MNEAIKEFALKLAGEYEEMDWHEDDQKLQFHFDYFPDEIRDLIKADDTKKILKECKKYLKCRDNCAIADEDGFWATYKSLMEAEKWIK